MNLFCAVGLALAVGAPGVKEAVKAEAPAALVGVWACEEVIQSGTALPSAEAGWLFEFAGDRTFRWRQADKVLYAGTYTADAARDPAWIDLTLAKGEDPTVGIYRLEKDALTICLTVAGDDRPARFEAKPMSGAMLLKFKRAQPPKD